MRWRRASLMLRRRRLVQEVEKNVKKKLDY